MSEETHIHSHEHNHDRKRIVDKEYLIHKKPLTALLAFSFPMIIGNLFQQFYNMADSVVVGRFVSENALAAVGASHSLTFVFISIATGGGIGASVITGRYFGARSYREMVVLAFIVFRLIKNARKGKLSCGCEHCSRCS